MFFAVGPNKATFTACRHNCKTIDLHWGAFKKKKQKQRRRERKKPRRNKRIKSLNNKHENMF